MTFNILYCSDNNYAPYLGISIMSVLESNKDAEKIVFYVVSDNISEENLKRLEKQISLYGENRSLVLIDGNAWIKRLQDLKLMPYRGGLTTNLRLYFREYIGEDVERLLYLDCDTLVCESLEGLFSTPMGDAAGAVVLESLVDKEYKNIIGFEPKDFYFNAGMVLFDVKNWIKHGCDETLYKYMNNPEYHYPNNDQDFLNLLLKEHHVILSPKYNFQTIHQAYSDKIYFKTYSGEGYYSREEIEESRKAPVILHMYRFLGQFPWHKKAIHPWRELWWQYVAKSLWSDICPRENKGKVFAVERVIYRVCPKSIFLPLFKKYQVFYFTKKMKELKRKAEEVVNK